MLKSVFIINILLFTIGCTPMPSIYSKKSTIHKNIESNKQEAKLAQEEYNKIKNQRINT